HLSTGHPHGPQAAQQHHCPGRCRSRIGGGAGLGVTAGAPRPPAGRLARRAGPRAARGAGACRGPGRGRGRSRSGGCRSAQARRAQRGPRAPAHCHALLHFPPAGLTMTAVQWSDGAPIYRQLKERVIEMMLDGVLKPGDALPSVRQVAAEYQLNPITVSRAYQELADEALVEKRRGLGMYVTEEASRKLLENERERFLTEEWPAVLERIARLGLDVEKLLAPLKEARE